MSKGRYSFLIEDDEGKAHGSAAVRVRYDRKKMEFETWSTFLNQEKISLAVTDDRGLVRLELTTRIKAAGRNWTHLLWMCRRGEEYVLYRKRLGFSWREDVAAGGGLYPFATAMLFSYFALHRRLIGRTVFRTPIYNPDRLWLGEAIARTNGSISEIQFQPSCSHVSQIERKGIVRWADDGPTELSYPNIGMRIRRVTKLKGRLRPVRRVPIPSANLHPSEDKLVGREIIGRFRSGKGPKLVGTLEIPRIETRLPVAILVHGSGPETGDSGFGYSGRDYERSLVQPFRQLSRNLVRRGIPVFRYDKRGIGKSKGSWGIVSRSDLVDDLLAATQFVASRLKKRDIILIGFSEGANLAASVALHYRTLKGVVLAGAPAHTTDRVIMDKFRWRSKQDAVDKKDMAIELRAMKDVFKRIRSLDQQARGKKINISYQGYSFDWWAEHLRHDPLVEAVKIKTPVLLLHGDEDCEVLAQEYRTMATALKSAGIHLEKRLFKGLNHFFAPAFSGYPTFEYDVPQAIPDVVADSIVSWVKDLSA